MLIPYTMGGENNFSVGCFIPEIGKKRINVVIIIYILGFYVVVF